MKKRIKSGEMLCSTTVRIETTDKNGNITGSGTGFFYSIQDESTYIPMIITNKHVIRDCSYMQFVFTHADRNGNRLNTYSRIKIECYQDEIVFHPDSTVDICAISIGPAIELLRAEGTELYTHFFTNTVLANKERTLDLDAIEEILMVGYPLGKWDEINNLPITRIGITATDPKIDYNGKKEFLIDAACFPGSSGSPIIYLDRSSTNQAKRGALSQNILLLGILYSGPLHAVSIIDENSVQLSAVANIPANLGRVIKAERVLELEKEIIKGTVGRKADISDCFKSSANQSVDGSRTTSSRD
jgi:hypothetical protein